MNKQELVKKIADERGIFSSAAKEILESIEAEGWLHSPDQVPGRTITESEFNDALKDSLGHIYRYVAERFLDRLGITVVPDPEPTNVDRLKALYMEWKREGPTALDFAEWMDIRGVKAPGGDE